MTLGQFLGHAARTGFAWGRFDCLLWLADWAVLNGHPDPGARWRGRYATALGCRRLVNREGGMTRTAARGARGAGLLAIKPAEARPGDIGVGLMETFWGRSIVGLIRTRVGWAALAPRGVIVGPADVSRAWRI